MHLIDGPREKRWKCKPAHGHIADLGCIAAAITGLAQGIDVGQKSHIDAHRPSALAHTATRSESLLVDPECLSIFAVRIDLDERALDTEITSRRDDPLTALIENDTSARCAFNGLMGARLQIFSRHRRGVFLRCHNARQRVHDQCALAGTRYAAHPNQDPARNSHVDVLQIVRARAPNRDPGLRRTASTHFDDTPSTQPASRGGIGSCNLIGSAARHDLTPQDAGTRPHVDDEVGGTNEAEVMLDHDRGVGLSSDLAQRSNQGVDLSWVHAARRLIEQDRETREPPGNDAHQLQSLRLTGGERRREPRGAQVTKAEIADQLQISKHGCQRTPREHDLIARQLDTIQTFAQRAQRHLGECVALSGAGCF